MKAAGNVGEKKLFQKKELVFSIIPVVLIIFAFIVLGPLALLLFNTEAFTILTVCTISAELVKANMVQYAVNFIVGGGILLAGAIAISRIVEKVFIPEPDARPDL